MDEKHCLNCGHYHIKTDSGIHCKLDIEEWAGPVCSDWVPIEKSPGCWNCGRDIFVCLNDEDGCLSVS